MVEKSLIKGNIKTIILKLLSDNGKMYGYEISQQVKKLSQDQILLTEGALYPMLHKMEAEALIQTEKVMIGKRTRKYYTLTPTGVTATQTRLQEFTAFVEAMQLILFPKPKIDLS